MNDCSPSFSCQITASSFGAAERMSTSASPSKSTAFTDDAPSALAVTTRDVNWDAPSFSYQATVSSRTDADSTSTSLSLSTSNANTDCAPSAELVTRRAVKVGPIVDPSFSYHFTESSLKLPTTRSMSPSPSISLGCIVVTPFASDVITVEDAL